MRKYFLSFLLAIIGVLLFTGDGFACVCKMTPTVYEEFQRSHIVFAGKAVSFRDDVTRYRETERFYTFSIETLYRGLEEKTVEIGVGSVNSSCFAEFVIGKSYLVYARDPKSTGFVARVKCGLVEEIEAAGDQISLINGILLGDPEPQVYGSLQFTDENGMTKSLPNTRITLNEGKTTFDAVTDENGVFKFPRVLKGSYTIVPVLTGIQRLDYATTAAVVVTKNGRIYTEPNATRIDWLSDNFRASGMARVDEDLPKSIYTELNVFPNYGVSGKITDSGGKTVKCEKAYLVNTLTFGNITSKDLIDRTLYGSNPLSGVSLCKNGAFNVPVRQKGKYILAIELKDRVFFYPGTDSHADAEIIEVNIPSPQQRDFKLLRVPPPKKK